MIANRLPPGGFRLAPAALEACRRRAQTAAQVAGEIAARLGAKRVDLYASGSEALRVALQTLAQRSGRDEVVVPAYTCYTVPAAAVAAGLRVRLVDVTPTGRIDAAALARLPLERAAAVVTCNLFGIADPVEPVRLLARDAGAVLVDDAAQALGAASPWGPAGSRGSVGLLSFGRGKPLPGLGGGALAWCEDPPPEAPPSPAPSRLRALLRALGHDLVLSPRVFGWAAAIPALHVGETRFDPRFDHGEIPGAALALVAALLPRFDEEARRRAARARAAAERLRAETHLEPLLAVPAPAGVYPRLAVLASGRRERDALVEALAGEGVGCLYPRSLDRIDELRGYRADPQAGMPGARALAERLFTLPTHEGFAGGRASRTLDALAQRAPRRQGPPGGARDARPPKPPAVSAEANLERRPGPSRLRALARLVRSADARRDAAHEAVRRLRGEPALPIAACGRVLVLCKGNLCRSPFAAALLARALPGMRVDSAGLAAGGGDPAEPGARRAAVRFGLCLDEHRTRRADAGSLAEADLILVMEAHQTAAVAERCPPAAARCRVLADYLEAGPFRIEDPWGHPDAEFDRVFQRIASALKRLASRLAPGRAIAPDAFTPVPPPETTLAPATEDPR